MKASFSEESVGMQNYLEKGREIILENKIGIIDEKDTRKKLYSLTQEYAEIYNLDETIPRETPRIYGLPEFKQDIVKIEHERLFGDGI